ncbi:MAG: hypothetical protein HOQ07_03695, partial [Sinomonas sp.]|nr:hypothetical protein [Sinomonas sp.]
GALAAEEASSRGRGETTPRDHDEAPEGGTATPEEEPEPSGLAQLGMGEPIEPTADEAAVSPEAPAEAAGAPIAAESAAAASAGSPSQTAAAGSSEPGTAPAGAPVGAAADDAVVLGDADGESYGAPGAAEGVETGAGHTTVMPAASPGVAGTTPVTQAAPVVDRVHGFEATRSYEEDAPEYEAFWFAVSQQRTAVDPQSGLPLFTLEPGQWILALQDRGSEFLVQSQDGRVGLLRDLSGIERG